jgi:integration host factor subunit alpha
MVSMRINIASAREVKHESRVCHPHLLRFSRLVLNVSTPEGDRMTITKADLANTLHENLGINKREALELVMAFFEEVSAELERGDTVKLSGFGVFCLRNKNSRPGRNPKTGEMIPVSARRVVMFHPSHILKGLVQAQQPVRSGVIPDAARPVARVVDEELSVSS